MSSLAYEADGIVEADAAVVIPIGSAYARRIEQGRERVASLRVENRERYEMLVPILNARNGYIVESVEWFAGLWGVTRRHASEQLRRFDEVGALKWMAKRGGKGSCLALLPLRSGKGVELSGGKGVELRSLARASEIGDLDLGQEQDLRARPCPSLPRPRKATTGPPPPGWRSLQELEERHDDEVDQRIVDEAHEIAWALKGWGADEGTLRVVLDVLTRIEPVERLATLRFAYDRTIAKQPGNAAAFLVGTLKAIGKSRIDGTWVDGRWVPDRYYEEAARA